MGFFGLKDKKKRKASFRTEARDFLFILHLSVVVTVVAILLLFSSPSFNIAFSLAHSLSDCWCCLFAQCEIRQGKAAKKQKSNVFLRRVE